MAANANIPQALIQENKIGNIPEIEDTQLLKEEEKQPANDDQDVDVDCNDANDVEVEEMLQKHSRRRGGIDHRTEPTVPDDDSHIGTINAVNAQPLMKMAGRKLINN